MAKKRGSIRPSESTMKEFDLLISKIHVNNNIKLTHEEYMKQSMVLMDEKYEIVPRGTMKQFDKYVVRIKVRDSLNGLFAKKAYTDINNRVLEVEVVLECDKDDKYSGEFALAPLESIDGVSWIASGDVEILCKTNTDVQ